MKTFTKAFVGTVAAGAMAVSAVAPAAARDRDRHDNGIGAGEIIAGALVIGGIAAIASAASNNRDRDYRDGRGYGYGRAGYSGYGRDNPRQAIEQCVNAAERRANRRSWGGRADVTDIRSVRETRNGYEVRGRIAVNTRGRDWNRNDGNYGRGWNNDYRGWNNNLRGYDSGTFTCKTDRGQVSKLNFSGIRGL